MRSTGIAGLRPRLPFRRIVEMLVVAIVMATLTLFIGDLPELEVFEAAVDDENFSDLVIKTRGELAIDTSIVILTYGPEMLDSTGYVDRSLLAQSLSALLTLEPAVVGLDYLIEEEKPEAPDGDEHLAGLLQTTPNVVLGLFREDSLDRFRMPPPSFGVESSKLGVINFIVDDDRTIRTFRPVWTTRSGASFDAFAVKLARSIDSAAVAEMLSLGADEFVIDYAGGIGEYESGVEGSTRHVFPTIPLAAVAEAIFSGDEQSAVFLHERIKGKAALVGYGDLSVSQNSSIVDRFWTPLKPEKNALPDMYGVGVHANIINTILQRRFIRAVPAIANVVWGTILVFVLYYGYEATRNLRSQQIRAAIRYPGFVLLVAIGVIVPVFAFRETTWKFSIYTPIAGLLLGMIALRVYDRLKLLTLDYVYRRRLRRPMPEALRAEMRSVLAQGAPRERYVQGLHVVHRLFHACCDTIFSDARISPALSRHAIARPMPREISAELEKLGVHALPQAARDASSVIRLYSEDLALERDLRLARSLAIALNEISRQNAALEEADLLRPDPAIADSYTDMALTMIGNDDLTDYEEFVGLYARLEKLARDVTTLLTDANGTTRDIPILTDDSPSVYPMVLRERCTAHDRQETFLYVCEQEDANSRDDHFDLLYAGATVRCRAEHHPTLSELRERMKGMAEEMNAIGAGMDGIPGRAASNEP